MARGKASNVVVIGKAKGTGKGRHAPSANGPVPVNHNEQGPTAGEPKAELTNDQRNALEIQWTNAYVRALDEKKGADAEFKNICKKARAELGADAVDRIKDRIELATPEGEARFKAIISRMAQSAKFVGVELDMFGSPTTDAKGKKLSKKQQDEIERVRQEGVHDGVNASPMSQKYPLDTPKGQAYLEGFNAGQATNRAKLAERVAAEQDFDESAPPTADDANEETAEAEREPATAEDDRF